ncbi:MAG: hypothetical protein U0325_21025 [Polyangiales bacterium]
MRELRNTLQKMVVQRSLVVIEGRRARRRTQARGGDGEEQVLTRRRPRHVGLHHAQRDALHVTRVHTLHRRLGERAAELHELGAKARRERGRDHAQGERVGVVQPVERHVLVGVGEQLQRVDDLEFVGGALEVHEVVRPQLVEHAAKVARSPRGRVALSHDDHVDAAGLPREGVLREHGPLVARQQQLQQHHQQRVPRRAQVRRIVVGGRGARRHEARPWHARCHDSRS